MAKVSLILLAIMLAFVSCESWQNSEPVASQSASAGSEYIVKKTYDYFDWFYITCAAGEDTTIGFIDERTNESFRAAYISFHCVNESYGKYFKRGLKDSMQEQHYVAGLNIEFERVAGDSQYFEASAEDTALFIGYAAGFKN